MSALVGYLKQHSIQHQHLARGSDRLARGQAGMMKSADDLMLSRKEFTGITKIAFGTSECRLTASRVSNNLPSAS